MKTEQTLSPDKIELTGNPFVDTGLCVISHMAGLERIDDLSLKNIKHVFGDGYELANKNSQLKCFTQIFTTNNPLKQPSYSAEKRVKEYVETLKDLLDGIEESDGSGESICWSCGSPTTYTFKKQIGREWFPLSGSLGSDAQFLPAASSSPFICPLCLFSVHYLTFGTFLLSGKLAVLQSNYSDFQYRLIKDLAADIASRTNAGNYETVGSKEGDRVLLRRLLAFFRKTKEAKGTYKLPTSAMLYMWKFSNAGQNPACAIEEIPNSSLAFLEEVAKHGMEGELETLASLEKNPQYSLLRCVSQRRDYNNLYPFKKHKGSTPRLYELYQRHVIGRSQAVLKLSHKVASHIRENVEEREVERMKRKEAFRDRVYTTKVKKAIIELAERGNLVLDDYVLLFPYKEGSGVAIDGSGWEAIRYYLHNPDVEWLDEGPAEIYAPDTKMQEVKWYASKIEKALKERYGEERFRKVVLDGLRRGKIGISWLRRQFTQLSMIHGGFCYCHWQNLCKVDGRLSTDELVFQLRLLWSQRNGHFKEVPFFQKETGNTSGLPPNLLGAISQLHEGYVNERGVERFRKYILAPMLKGERGLGWFKKKLVDRKESEVPLSEDEWEHMLVDEEGNTRRQETLFQLMLALSNFYRESLKEKGGVLR